MLQSEKFSLQSKNILLLVQKHYSYSPKTFSFWYKNIIPTAQKYVPDSTKRFSRQPKKQLPAGSDLAGYGKYWQYTKLI